MSCATAHAFERYVDTHETLDGSFYWHGRQWLGTVLDRQGKHHTYVSPGHPTEQVWFDYKFGVN